MTNPSPNLVLVGPTGGGKSSLAKMLAAPLGLTAVDLDRIIEEREGADVATIFAECGEDSFRDREAAALEHVLAGDGLIVATGAGAVLRESSRALMKRRAFVVHVDVSVEEQLIRLRHDHTRPLLQRPDRETALREMATVRGPLYREVADFWFNNDSRRSAKSSCAQLLTHLSGRWSNA